MKRFASLATTSALAGALLIAGTASQAVTTYAMYLQPISSTTVTPGATASFMFRALVDIPGFGPNNNGTIALTLGAAITYDTSITGTSRTPFKFTKDPGTLPDGVTPLWDLATPAAYSTASNGALTFQGGVGHTKQVDPNDGVTIITIPAGTYTIGTFSVPIRSAGSGTLTINLPGALGLGGPNGSRDFVNNTSGNGTGTVNNDGVLVFPNDGVTKFSSLKVTTGPGGPVTPAPSSLLVVAMGAVPMVSVLRRRRSLKK